MIKCELQFKNHSKMVEFDKEFSQIKRSFQRGEYVEGIFVFSLSPDRKAMVDLKKVEMISLLEENEE